MPCNHIIKIVITKGKEIQTTAAIRGICEHCGKENTIQLPTAQVGASIINSFGLKQESKVKESGKTVYIYSNLKQ